MKFHELPYRRPDIETFKQQFATSIQNFTDAATYDQQENAMGQINGLRAEFETMHELAGIRHTIDTTDEFYKQEQDFFDEVQPVYEGLISDFYSALVNSKFQSELKAKWGTQLFKLAELCLKTFSPEIVDDLATENKLTSEYQQLLASAKIMFEGEERNLSQLEPFIQSADRAMRKRASEARYGFFVEHEAKLDDIYDQLVKVRTKVAKKLGYDNFVQLGYARMSRTDYNAEMVAKFRTQVLTYIVPAAEKLRERQRDRLGLDTLQYYDTGFQFESGNPTAKGSPEWIVDNGRKMYSELSAETDEFFQFMIDNGLMDLVSKKGKADRGYCTYLSKYKAPFIFSNFNGTSGDIDVLTHEAGHAYQVYQSRGYEIPEYNWPTLEACEIPSMSMEFFTWPWMELFFEEDTAKYKFYHLQSALQLIPYVVSGDEFQHFVYENPDATPAERKLAWREIERKYFPHRNYSENEYLERGGFWHQQSHLFRTPFYYIDYALAQICALQFWKRMHEDRDSAWADYVKLCKQGGSKPFTELVKVANLISPFEDGCVKSVIGVIEDWLDKIDDKKL
ncbi:M3 family oligoendopeptidase [Alicyclobacillus fastidiosus]|uniref:M3 family oligoendopeptidase n=1 Tax=Alicyclobacillus fastidiosus TaxID=392011 RepID=A0ABY6ZIQ8_9BACL|nr:M3 family oligoendopeptidase [Alicyclobacillus fastidiosus]WAH41996.1 M3 family oligoendopeptidase [Alicyclobacillus fastidiosus]GMA63733.1 oligoendopeptidase F [Alicyclobacillus fastidiosus]